MGLRLMMTADAVGGVWTYALDLARGLADVGGETTLVVQGPALSADQARAAKAVPALEVIETGSPLDWTAEAPGEIEDAGRKVRDLARELRPDMIHLNSPALAAVGGFPAPVLGACHSCLATWWMAVKTGPAPADFAWRTAALRAGLAQCDALVAPSRSFARATAAAYPGVRPLVVHNGRRPALAGPAVREPMVFTSGRLWDEGKNLATLDAAAALAPTPLYAAGPLEGPSAADRLRPDHLRPLGRLSADEVAAWLRRAPIYASSALYEPFGLGVLEAAQAGCALVLADIASFRELWRGAAVFVAPREPQAFADAFAALLDDEDRRVRLGELARGRAQLFTVEAMTRGMLSLYARLGAAPSEAAA